MSSDDDRRSETGRGARGQRLSNSSGSPEIELRCPPTDRPNERRKEGRGEKWRPFCDLFVPIGRTDGRTEWDRDRGCCCFLPPRFLCRHLGGRMIAQRGDGYVLRMRGPLDRPTHRLAGGRARVMHFARRCHATYRTFRCRARRGSLNGAGVKGWRHVGGAREVSRGGGGEGD